MNAKTLPPEKEVMIPPRKEISMQDALISIVQRTDIDPDRLEKFLDLQIKMENRQAEAALNEALANFQAECPIIQKTKKAHNSNYAPYDEIKHTVKPIAHKHGLSWSFTVLTKNEKENEMVVTVRHKLGAQFESRYTFPSMDDGGKMNESQRTKSANSYAKRACLENALDIASAEMDDDARRAIDNPITQAQLDELEKILASAHPNTKIELLKYMKVADFKDLTELEGKKALNAIKTKRANA